MGTRVMYGGDVRRVEMQYFRLTFFVNFEYAQLII